MANIGDFVGRYIIRNTVTTYTPENPLLQVDGKILIGTNSTFGDKKPYLTDGGYVVTGFAILDPKDQPVLATEDEQGTPLELALVGSDLRWEGWHQNKPLRIYISGYEINSLGGVRTRGLYGSTVFGDPEQVGVWGADDTPTPHGAPLAPAPETSTGG